MSQLFSVIAALLATVSMSTAALAGSEIVVTNNQKVTHTCKPGDTFLVTGNKNEVAVEGPCAQIQVMGNQNQIVTKKTAQTLSVSGNKNHVVMTRAKRISVTGNKNTISWHHGPDAKTPPKIRNLGKDNRILKKARPAK